MNKRLTYIVIAVVVLLALGSAAFFTYMYLSKKKAAPVVYAPSFQGFEATVVGTVDNGFKLKTSDGKEITAFYDADTLISVRKVEYVPEDSSKSFYTSEQLQPSDLVEGQIVKVVPPADKKDATEFVARQIAVVIERPMTADEFASAHALIDPSTVTNEEEQTAQ